MKNTICNKTIITDKNWNLYADDSIVLSIVVIYNSKRARTNAKSLNWNDSQVKGQISKEWQQPLKSLFLKHTEMAFIEWYPSFSFALCSKKKGG